MKYKLHFINQNIIWEAEGGSVADACAGAGIPLYEPCGGHGICGKCQVTIRRSTDRNSLGERGLEEVLACRTMVDEDMDIFVSSAPETEYVAGLIHSSESADMKKIHPSIHKVFHSADELPAKGGFLMQEQAPLTVMRRYSLWLSEPGFQGATFVYFNEELIDIQLGDTTDMLYGAAVDIGTTTVALYIYDLNTGEQLAVESAWNSQAVYGADVIARINYAGLSEEHLQEMQKRIIEAIRQMIRGSGLTDQQMENLYHITVCGNSAMQHLFLGLNPKALGVSPFVSICGQSLCVSVKELFQPIPVPMSDGRADPATVSMPAAECGVIEFLPLLGGFVGADTTAVLLTLPIGSGNNHENGKGDKSLEDNGDNPKEISEEGLYLVVDLGTNGEIALGNHENGFLVASTACGPALEGGNISCGMRAEPGAIDRIRLVDGEIHLHWIGKEEGVSPKGLCGSGLVDAIALLRELEIIDVSGRLLSQGEYLKLYRQPPSDYRELREYRKKRKLSRRIRETETETGTVEQAFFLTMTESPVTLTQKDIRQFQLAKSAIRAGCKALLAEAGITSGDITPGDIARADISTGGITPGDMDSQIDRLILSGAFGNYIDLEHAMSLGLLPRVSLPRVSSIGNGAGLGVCRLLLHSHLRRKMYSVTKNARHIELGNHPVFMKEYLQNMNLEIR